MLTRRQAIQLAGAGAVGAALPRAAADYVLSIAETTLEVSRKKHYKTLAYNNSVPGPLLRLREGRPVTIDVHNNTTHPEIVHWHGLFLPPAVDGAMEEGTPMVAPGAASRYSFTPRPAGTRWYHSHIRAGGNLNLGLYSSLHGFLIIEPRENLAPWDQEACLLLHDYGGQLRSADDGSMNPAYDVSTINGKVLGFGEPLRVRQRQRLLLRILNASATEVHWLSFAGHTLEVLALDGNAIPRPTPVSMLRLAPAERADVLVTLDNPGVWVLGEVREHVQKAGMGIVVEYEGRTGTPRWLQPPALLWSYAQFAAPAPDAHPAAIEIPLVFTSKFTGHGAMQRWQINGKSYPETETPVLTRGQRYRLIFRNLSSDNHPVHLHRHTFDVVSIAGGRRLAGLAKDTVLVMGNTVVEAEFTADEPGPSLFHCHQQDHMDMGFMMLFRYA